MTKVLGIFRGFPGLGRVVAGVSLLETLRDRYGFQIKLISYLQGDKYLAGKGYSPFSLVTSRDYCSIGIVPTSPLGIKIFDCISEFRPDLILVDGEPLMMHALRICFPSMKIVALLNPSDVENPAVEPMVMKYLLTSYTYADLAIVHGLRKVDGASSFNNIISVNTVIRSELSCIKRIPSNQIYCVLGGGTVNAGSGFASSTIQLAKLSIETMKELPDFDLSVVCSSENIYDIVSNIPSAENVKVITGMLDALEYYSDGCFFITRCGRNSLSELAYLQIPAAAYVSGDKYRKEEQENNLRNLNSSSIVALPATASPLDLALIIKNGLTSSQNRQRFFPGNAEALKAILELLA